MRGDMFSVIIYTDPPFLSFMMRACVHLQVLSRVHGKYSQRNHSEEAKKFWTALKQKEVLALCADASKQPVTIVFMEDSAQGIARTMEDSMEDPLFQDCKRMMRSESVSWKMLGCDHPELRPGVDPLATVELLSSSFSRCVCLIPHLRPCSLSQRA